MGQDVLLNSQKLKTLRKPCGEAEQRFAHKLIRCSRPFVPILFLLAVWLVPSSASAETTPIRFEHLSLDEGLSQGTVTAILQDRDGFMWFGTQSGLNRYDGHRFDVFRHDATDPSSLAHDYVRTMIEDHTGDIWVGTFGGGLSRWRRSGQAFENYQHDPTNSQSLPDNRIRSVYQSRSGSLWVATEGGGLSRLDIRDGTFQTYRYNPEDPRSLSGNSVTAVYEDRLGTLWVGTDTGLNRFDPLTETFQRYQHDATVPTSIASDRIMSILENRSGELWIGTRDGGLNLLERQTGHFKSFHHDPENPRSLGDSLVRSLYEDREGHLWIGTDRGLDLLKRSSMTFAHYRHLPENPSSLSNNRIVSVYQDRGGVLWIGTQGGGLNKWNPIFGAFSNYTCEQTCPNLNNVHAIHADTDSRVWIGTFNGLYELDRSNGVFKAWPSDPNQPNTLSGRQVTALASGPRGTLWVGTLSGGLNRLDAAGRWHPYQHDPTDPSSLGANGIMHLAYDRQETLWVGTFGGGLHRYSPERDAFDRFQHDPDDPNSLSSDHITAIIDDPQGSTLWVGTYGNGLNRFHLESGRFEHFSHRQEESSSLSNNLITSLYASPSGVLWIGTEGGGLNRLDTTEEKIAFKAFATRDGLPDNAIYSIEPGQGGELWLSTAQGLSRFDPNAETFENFTAHHGLQSNEFNLGASFRSQSGELFFGGVQGFNIFFPNQIRKNPHVPPVVLTSFQKLGQPVALDRPASELDVLTLSHRDYAFSLEFAAMDFTAPQANRYAYKLAGLGDDWIDLGHHRRVTLTNLDPGNYTLEVRGSNNDGIWNDHPLRLEIEVLPPPWRTAWAYIAYGAFLLGLALYTLRVRQVKSRRARVLEQARNEALIANEAQRIAEEASRSKSDFLAQMSHEMRTPLNGIIGTASLLEHTELTQQQQKFLQTMQVSGKTLLTLINDILDLSKIESGRLEIEQVPIDLRACIEESLSVVAPGAAEKQLELIYWIEAGTPEKILGDGTRLRQILTNLLSNAVKFTHSGEVLVTVAANSAPEQTSDGTGAPCELLFTVQDSGIGIPPGRQHRLFQPFSQVDKSTARRYGGTGLGLAICKSLCELMGGQIQVESSEGTGSTFQFTIRAAALDDDERNFLYQANPQWQSSTLLLVIENPILRQVLKRQLNLWGLETVTYGALEDLLAALEPPTGFEYIFLDHRLLNSAPQSVLNALEPITDRTILISNSSKIRHRVEADFQRKVTRPVRPLELHRLLKTLLREQHGNAVEREPTLHPAVAKPDASETPELRILLAEDHDINQMVILQMLERMGLHADVVSNGLEVIQAMREKHYDLILMDVQMPEMDGLETTRRIRQLNGHQPYILAVTAHSMPQDQERCAAAGMDAFLSKPLQINRLREAITKVPLGTPAPSAPPALPRLAGGTRG